MDHAPEPREGRCPAWNTAPPPAAIARRRSARRFVTRPESADTAKRIPTAATAPLLLGERAGLVQKVRQALVDVQIVLITGPALTAPGAVMRYGAIQRVTFDEQPAPRPLVAPMPTRSCKDSRRETLT